MNAKLFNKSCPGCHSRPRKLGIKHKIKYYGCPNGCNLWQGGMEEGHAIGLSNEEAQANWNQRVEWYYRAFENMKLFHVGEYGEIWLDFDDKEMARYHYLEALNMMPNDEDAPSLDDFTEFTEEEYNSTFTISWKDFKRFFSEPRFLRMEV
jgi:hypothetical protein